VGLMRFSFFLKAFFFPGFAAGFAISRSQFSVFSFQFSVFSLSRQPSALSYQQDNRTLLLIADR